MRWKKVKVTQYSENRFSYELSEIDGQSKCFGSGRSYAEAVGMANRAALTSYFNSLDVKFIDARSNEQRLIDMCATTEYAGIIEVRSEVADD